MPAIGNYVYASSADLKEILPDKYAVLTMEDPIFQDLMPIASVDAGKVIWDQRDSFRGLAGARAPGGPYNIVQREGITRYEMRPGYYGDKKIITEEMMTEAAEIGTFGTGIKISGIQSNDQDHLLTRALQRIKLVAWNFFTSGSYSYIDKNGVVCVEDAQSLTPFTTSVAWSSHSTATPLYDLRQAKLRHRGHSVSFGKDAKLYLNSQDVNDLLSNSNANDLGGFRAVILGPAAAQSVGMTLYAVNEFLLRNDLPQIVEWDDTYIDDSGATQLYIAQGYGVLVGKRLKGEPVSEFVMTRNPELMFVGTPNNATGKRVEAFDNLYYNFHFKHEPLRGISAMSFNGAPAIYYPSAVIPFRPSGGGSDA